MEHRAHLCSHGATCSRRGGSPQSEREGVGLTLSFTFELYPLAHSVLSFCLTEINFLKDIKSKRVFFSLEVKFVSRPNKKIWKSRIFILFSILVFSVRRSIIYIYVGTHWNIESSLQFLRTVYRKFVTIICDYILCFMSGFSTADRL